MGRLTCLKPRVSAAPPSRLAERGAAHGHERAARGGEWRQIRKRVFTRACGMCEVCTAAGRFVLAEECDHKVPVWEGGTDADHNLQALCKDCHKAKTAIEATRRYAGGVAR